MLRTLKIFAVVLVVAFVLAQLLQPDRSNPPLQPAADFLPDDQPPLQLASAVKRACFDCHSNSTEWPWYSHIAPASWLVARDVKQGRVHLNFSDWRLLSREMAQIRLTEACEEVKAGKMPPAAYLVMHPEARLSEQEKQAVCAATL